MNPPKGLKRNHSLKDLTWWKVGGKADYFVEPQALLDLKEAYLWAHVNHLPVTLLGDGTNVLVSDKGIEGLVISMAHFKGVKSFEEAGVLKIEALAGTEKSEVLKIFLKHKLAPAIFLTGLPGTIGGGVVMNAGVGEDLCPREFCEITEWIEVLRITNDNEVETHRFLSENLTWKYRYCGGWQPGLIFRVGLRWPLKEEPDLIQKQRAATRKRVQSQPLSLPSCGSVFRNPLPLKAAKLIDECGLKGLQRGGAMVSEKHANFIVNVGEATAEDIFQLIQDVKKEVFAQKGIELTPEVVFLGRWNGMKTPF
ncbi:MAG: UDP-N-acetylmuramate dehydrogenase [Bdellovibrio sp.]|nr:MAG: UDP-N-acetylmuramate dehydrogenase [Bdellovibrio sp.]